MHSIVFHKAFFLSLLIMSKLSGMGQFAPPPGNEGTTAIHADSSVIEDWAMQVDVVRGYLNAADSGLGKVNHGEPLNAAGKANNQVVSLGDGGTATYSFDTPVVNGEGADFAIYENSFSDDFLELAFVEVSSDGQNFVRFPAVSRTQTDSQISSFGKIEATNIYNLAGKYRVLYGTPFDLSELADSSGVDIMNIRHIRIRDVVGSLSEDIASYDSEGNIINDPWPTEFNSGGFDLDALAVINNNNTLNSVTKIAGQPDIYPNPVTNNLIIDTKFSDCIIQIISANGTLVQDIHSDRSRMVIDMRRVETGLYFVRVINSEMIFSKKIVKK